MLMRVSVSSTVGLLAVGLVFGSLGARAQESSTPAAAQKNLSKYPPVVHLTAEQDHQRTMELLGIKELRPGRDGYNKSSPNAANYNESKANPYPHLPDPLVLNDGKRVKTAKVWWKERRPQIVEMFDREMYGRVPAHTPAVHWEVTATKHGEDAGVATITKVLVGHVDNSEYPLIDVNIKMELTTPANASGPVPIILEYGFLGPLPFKLPPPPPGPTWQEMLLQKGWGYAVLAPYSVQADNGAGLTEGIIGLCNHGQPRKLDDWGALRAWAWAGSRAMDYFETDRSVNAKQVGVTGHSRFGKAALVTMAYDQRFAIGYISSSGEGGAKLSRRNWGETVENLAASGEYHWMAGNFLRYAGPLHWNDLPVDAHELIALCAPRPVFVSAGTLEKGDGWVDARGMFMAEVAAGPVYRLLGAKGLSSTTFPPVLTPDIGGDLAWRQHGEGHTPLPNWPTFIEFASRYLNAPHGAS
ncbi:MAG TPA: acetylxylan esterase [Acidobacteriaceae bacterium]|jgi:hypothetical protein|nr:acetylxylan esterase [Acidobacteriaceae bacterium]